MQHGDAVAEVRAEAGDGLRRERDLRHQHDRRPAARVHDLLQELDVDQRLARRGDAVKQDGPGRGRVQRRYQPPVRAGLGGVGRQVGGRFRTGGSKGVAHDLLVADLHDPLPFQGLHDPAAYALVEKRGERD